MRTGNKRAYTFISFRYEKFMLFIPKRFSFQKNTNLHNTTLSLSLKNYDSQSEVCK